MQVSVEAPTKLERRVTVIVPVEKLEEAYDKRITHLSRTAKVNGFRQGKIPLEYIEQRFGQSARQEALSEVIQASLYDAIHQEKLQPVGVPTVEPKAVIAGQPLEFVATFEIFPEIDSVNFEMTAMEKQIANIDEPDIDYVIQHLRQQHTSWQKVERPAQEKDRVVIDFMGKIEGVPIPDGKAEHYPLVLGSHVMVPGFEEGIIGMEVGNEKCISLTFPESYFSKEYAGKPVEFAIKLHSVLAPNVPEVDAAFIKKMGVKSGEQADLCSEIRKNLERELKRLIKEKVKKQVFDHILEKNPLEIPKAMISREAKRIHDELHPHHAGQEHGHTEAEMAVFNHSAQRNVTLGVLVAKLLKQYQVSLDKERLTAHIEQLASIYQNSEEVLKFYSEDKKSKADAEMYILEEQLVEKLLENVKISEVTLSYQEFIKPVPVQTNKESK